MHFLHTSLSLELYLIETERYVNGPRANEVRNGKVHGFQGHVEP
jgi:hypothetical protein